VNIIYFDDDATNRALLRDMLALEGHDVTEAADAVTGLALVADRDFDLILMDIRMPGISGVTAIRQIRSSSTTAAKLPIIVVTADLTPGIAELCRGAGADGFLEKPIMMDELFRTVAQFGGKSRRTA